jgi:UDP-2,3-diacylglucosamine pyrophosphatase LpxH
MSSPNTYCWFKNNAKVLTDFLDEQLKDTTVKEVVILGDLFDTWVIPANYDPLTNFANICSNPVNKPVIDKLAALAASPDIKLAYVPGNHDMGMDANGIIQIKQFMEQEFRGIRFFCNTAVPWGVYNVGTLAAEHGNHYCLFNAPDTWTANNTFLPLGYFISRIVAYKVKHTGTSEDYYDILTKFLTQVMNHHDVVGDLFDAVAADAGLAPNAPIDLKGVPGYPNTTTVGDIGNRFRNLVQKWSDTPGNCNSLAATVNDLGNLYPGASSAYFEHFGSNTNIVIFGHTHIPVLVGRGLNPLENPANQSPNDPWTYIYANCGSWVDGNENGCTYVETEEDVDAGRHYVRVISYPARTKLHEGFVKM